MLQEAEEDHNYPNLSLVPAGFLRLLFGFYSPARGGNAIPTTHGVSGALGNVNMTGTGSCDRWGPGRGAVIAEKWDRAVAGDDPHLFPG